MMEVHDYTWIFAVGMVVAFLDAYGIGANDVANSFATSVSSNSLTLAQACIVACFTEFLGAVLLGANTAGTIKGGILSPDNYVDQPEMLMLAMLCALCGSAAWVLTACKFGWPVSSTHSIVGAIIGVGIAGFGPNSIYWGWEGVAKIISSWFISPVAAGLVAAFIYTITKYAILRRVESFKWGIRLVPVYCFVTIAIEAFYIMLEAPGLGEDVLGGMGGVIGIAIGIAAVFAAFCQFFFCPWVVRRVKGREYLKWYHMFVIPWLSKRRSIEEVDAEKNAQNHGSIHSTSPNEVLNAGDEKMNKLDTDGEVIVDEAVVPKESMFSRLKKKAVTGLMNGINQDVRNLENEKLTDMHANAEIFEDDAEYLFSFLQVITACMASFAHGSNDVSNAVGPISSIYEIWNSASVSENVGIPVWILVYGGIGIDIGLATMGYRVMRAMGNNITFFTPSRGFCAELAAALTVLTCSKIGVPVSTTLCITGASAAIGLCNKNGYKAVNWKMLGFCGLSWVITLPCAGTVAGLLFAICANAPKFI
ncbi:solute carrier family 20 [Helicostylum pulchrum]|uniref:Phosphate transporter n=1 Tax=Helicostylum pulchrum TaxID=562976 RepID=A0ABP9Y9U8_9FUNG|nr:solute carrier family 20 [Helicostylum pulchrum]